MAATGTVVRASMTLGDGLLLLEVGQGQGYRSTVPWLPVLCSIIAVINVWSTATQLHS